MHRFSLKPDHGMLFVFDAPQPLAFWMKNTFVPLSIAFIGVDGKILNIEYGTTDGDHTSVAGIRALCAEMKKDGSRSAIVAGDLVEGLSVRRRRGTEYPALLIPFIDQAEHAHGHTIRNSIRRKLDSGHRRRSVEWRLRRLRCRGAANVLLINPPHAGIGGPIWAPSHRSASRHAMTGRSNSR
jgi:uncharacterized membrane protein (UPF0127 family)